MADTRKDKRAPVALKVRFKSATLEEFIEQYSTDISPGGIFIKSGKPMKVGTLLKFQFQLKDESPLIRGVGRVVWTRTEEDDPEASPGMGIKFIKIGNESQETLDRVLREPRDGPGTFEAGQNGVGEEEHEEEEEHGEGDAASAAQQQPFFPSTSSEEDLPPPEDRTNVRHASEFLAGALSGVEDEDAAREARLGAEQARKRTEQIEAERTVARAQERSAEQPKTQPAPEATAQPSIMVDPSLAESAPEAPPEPDEAPSGVVSGAQDAQQAPTDAAEPPKPKPVSTQALDPTPISVPLSGPPSGTPTAKGGGAGRALGLLLLFLAVVGGATFAYLATQGDQGSDDDFAALEGDLPPMPEPEPEPEPEVAPEPEPEPEPEVAPEPEPEPEAKLVPQPIESTPKGAEVFVNDKSKGTTPLSLQLPEGQASMVRVKAAGHAEVVQEITGEADAKSITLELPPLAYVLSVKTDPPGAVVRAGRFHETSPTEIELGALKGKQLYVLAFKNGYHTARRTIPRGEFQEENGALRVNLNLTLKPMPGQKGSQATEEEADEAPKEPKKPAVPSEEEAPKPEPAPAAPEAKPNPAGSSPSTPVEATP